MNEACNDEMIFNLGEGVKFLPGERCIVNESGTVIGLSENSYRFLLLILNGETDKQAIIKQVWHEQRGSVSDSSYYGQIYMLRKAFSLVGLPNSLIKTIPRKGVKYMGKVEKKAADAAANAVAGEAILLDKACMLEESQEVNAIRLEEEDNQPVLPAEEAPQTRESKDMAPWYNSKRWNFFITVLAVIAVCWLTTLLMAVFYFFR
ncbi:transcriptional regulator [Mixta tenebrionis]|uniref:Transcriptional regulator n=1 Tax=Mixta tenebrionis TaxID=2562439 RepID=A0A506V9T4_9GAMM|nr:transcriptional regulator [Mixta tenebrionis]TPW42050.1 transcriptional regulator [Mixta tenebrionis]